MKKNLMAVLGGIMGFFVMSAQADSPWDDPQFSCETGYIGIIGGSFGGSASFQEAVTLNNSTLTESRYHFSKNRLMPGLELGGGVSHQYWYFGGDISTTPLPVTANINRVNTFINGGVANRDQITMYDFANLDFVPGIYFSQQFLLYLRLGGAAGEAALDQKENGQKEFDFHEGLYGGRVGIGFDFFFSPAVSMGVDYIMTRYGNVSFSNVSPIDGLFKDINLTSPTSHFVGLHLRYNFGRPDFV